MAQDMVLQPYNTCTDGERVTPQAVGLRIFWNKHTEAWKRGITQGVNIKENLKMRGLGGCHPSAVDSSTNRKAKAKF